MLAERVSKAIGQSFKLPSVPTVVAKLPGSGEIAFSHFRNFEAKPGLSTPSPHEEAFVFNVPLKAARFSTVSIDGRSQSVVQTPGKAYLFDLSSRNEVSLDAIYNSIRFHIPRTTIDALAYEMGARQIRGLHSKLMGEDDPVLYGLATTMLPIITNAYPVTSAFMECMAVAFHDHVIHTYGGAFRRTSQGGLAPWQMRRVSEFIEANLANDPSITALSLECGLSVSYFPKAFRMSMGMTPHQFIMKRRVERAKTLMIASRDSLAEISLGCGFVDQSHLGRHFLRQEGITPAQWRRLHGGR